MDRRQRPPGPCKPVEAGSKLVALPRDAFRVTGSRVPMHLLPHPHYKSYSLHSSQRATVPSARDAAIQGPLRRGSDVHIPPLSVPPLWLQACEMLTVSFHKSSFGRTITCQAESFPAMLMPRITGKSQESPHTCSTTSAATTPSTRDHSCAPC